MALPDFSAGLVSLNLSGNGLGGALPANWTSGFPALQALVLSGNTITGKACSARLIYHAMLQHRVELTVHAACASCLCTREPQMQALGFSLA